MPLIQNVYLVYSIPYLSCEPGDAYEDIGAVTIIGIDSDRNDAKKLALEYVKSTLEEASHLKLVRSDTTEGDYINAYYLSHESDNLDLELNEINGEVVVIKHIH